MENIESKSPCDHLLIDKDLNEEKENDERLHHIVRRKQFASALKQALSHECNQQTATQEDDTLLTHKTTKTASTTMSSNRSRNDSFSSSPRNGRVNNNHVNDSKEQHFSEN